MKLRFAVAFVTLPLGTAACSGGTATSTPSVTGEVCGVIAWAGGVSAGVEDPALLHVCPSGEHGMTSEFRIMTVSGRRY